MTSYTLAPSIRTWANGYGLWHAEIVDSSHGDDGQASRAARDAILAELAQREGPSFAPESVRVELVSRREMPGYRVSVFGEVDS